MGNSKDNVDFATKKEYTSNSLRVFGFIAFGMIGGFLGTGFAKVLYECPQLPYKDLFVVGAIITSSIVVGLIGGNTLHELEEKV